MRQRIPVLRYLSQSFLLLRTIILTGTESRLLRLLI